jgi:methenyltetrahydromethanopterin cyclohydrolase
MISVNRFAGHLIEALRADAEALRITVSTGERGETLIDAGANTQGGIAAGLRIAKICMGGLGTVQILPDAAVPRWPWSISIASSCPVVACLASQYAGWSLSHGEKPNAFFALGSGPARALARKEKLFQELDYADAADTGVLVLESPRPPPPSLVERIAQDCRIAPDQLAIIYAPTQSLAGSVQVVARVLEVALHKAHALGFPLQHIVDGVGIAPLPPPHPDFVTAMGRTNDAVILAGRVHLFVNGPAAEARGRAPPPPAPPARPQCPRLARLWPPVR